MSFAQEIIRQYNQKAAELSEERQKEIFDAVEECKRLFRMTVSLLSASELEHTRKFGILSITIKKQQNMRYHPLSADLKQALLNEGMIVGEQQLHNSDCPITTAKTTKGQCECDWTVKIPIV